MAVNHPNILNVGGGAVVTYSDTTPVSGTTPGTEGQVIFVTTDGLPSDTPTEGYVYDADSDSWSKMPGGGGALTTTSLTPESGNGTTYETAKVTNQNTVADVLKLSDGTHVFIGDKITWTAHGLPLHSYAFLTDTAPGYTFTEPASGLVQRLFYVYDANTIEAVLEPATNANGSGSLGVFAKTVYFNGTNPTAATIFDLENPPLTNDNALKADPANVYIGTDNQMWAYNSGTSTYNTYKPSKAVFKAKFSSSLSIGTSGPMLGFSQIQINTTPTAWNNPTGTFTAPSSGYYLASASLGGYSASLPNGAFLEISVQVNTVTQNSFLIQNTVGGSANLVVNGAVPVFMNAGDTLRFTWATNASLQSHVNSTYASITQI